MITIGPASRGLLAPLAARLAEALAEVLAGPERVRGLVETLAALPVPLTVNLAPARVTLPNSARVGTVIATVRVLMSDGSLFAGEFGADDQVRVAGDQLVLSRDLGAADDGIGAWRVVARQLGASAIGVLPVRVAPAGLAVDLEAWFPAGSSAPLPVVVVTGGTPPGGGYEGWWPPSYAHPLPVQVISGAVPAVDTWYPPTWQNPLACHQVAGGGILGDETWFPPNANYPLPVELITSGSDPQVDGWWPPSRAHPLPIVLV